MELADVLVDEDAFYADIRNAETDAERGEVFTQYVLAPLDSGHEPESVDTVPYDDVIAPLIEDELGADVPDTEILKYDDGRQLTYDVFMGLIGRSAIGEAIGGVVEERVPAQDADWGTQLTYDVCLQEEMVPIRTTLSKVGGGTLAITDPYNDYDPDETDSISIAYSKPDLTAYADEQGSSFDDVLASTLVHEGIHTVQMAEYPELNAARKNAMETIATYIGQPERMIGELHDLSLREIWNDPHAPLNVFGYGAMMPSMSLFEGHAEFYTPRITGAGQQDTDASTSLRDRVLAYTPMGAKRSQYVNGREFIETLHARGEEYVEYTLHNPPESMDAINNPDQWAAHVETQLN